MSNDRPSLGVLSRAPTFAALFGARAVSLIGDGVGNLALVVHVQEERGTGTAVGLLLLVAALPRLLSPLAGTVADRFDRRLLLAAGELAQGVLLIVALVWLPPLPVLLALLLAKSTVVAVSEPAGQAAVPALVHRDDLVAANSLLGALREAGEVVGPLLGGLVVAAGGVRAGLAVDALTFLVSVPLLARVPPLPPGPREGTTLHASLAGLRYTVGHPVARALALGFLLAGLTAADDVALPFLARTLGAGERGIGVLYAGVGAGLLAGYALLVRRGRRVPAARGFLLGGVVAALGNLLTGVAPWLVAAVAFQIVRGLGLALFESTLQTLLQRTVPAPLLGRVFANVYGAVNLGACVALVGGGALLDATSDRFVLVACGVVGLAAVAASGVLLPLRDVEQQ